MSLSKAEQAFNSAKVNLNRAKAGDQRSIVLLFDKANWCYALAVADFNPLSNYLKAMGHCSCFLEQATRPMEEIPEEDRDFVVNDREFWTAHRQIKDMESLMQKCISKIDVEMGGEYAI